MRGRDEQTEVVIKGIREGLLIVLGDGPWEERLARLEQRLRQGAAFFQGGRAAVDVGERALTSEEIDRVRALLARYGIELWALLSPHDSTALAAARQGLAIQLGPEPAPEEGAPEEEAEEPPPFGVLFVERTLRSGQQVRYPGHVVVLGDVHAGAEVVAGGHVIVWGKLHGTVHAGAMGDEEAVVCALDLRPTQLRIAGHIARPPEDDEGPTSPEVARVEGDHIEAVPWDRR